MRYLLLSLFLLLPGLTWAPQTTDLVLLRSVLCHWETRGERNPQEAIGLGQEIGRCQIKPSSARMAMPDVPLAELLVRLVVRPEPIAEAILTECQLRRIGAFALADCYHRGPYASGVPTGRDREYAKQAASDYAEAYRKRIAR